MRTRLLVTFNIGIFLALMLLGGCAKKIVKQQAGPPIPGLGGSQISEADVHGVQSTLRVIYFDFDKYGLSPEAQAAVQYNAEILKGNPQVSVIAEGHCDERGTSEYNLALGERRAGAVAEFLSTLGIAPNRISTVSFGSELPVDPAHNEEAWAKNRRVYLRVAK
ncbi:MAG: peptidoglycan-associated lipoprotein Pal [Syntrophaceae bacterium]|nr:peptidoglycan-associated lipoprotein Pal [Syntrophaceae bacterium]